MTYTELFTQYKSALHQAVNDYRALFPNQVVPVHRATEIQCLEAIWNRQPELAYEPLVQETRTVCQQFKTGLFRRSQLRTHLMRVIEDPNYSSEQFYTLMAQENAALKEQVKAKTILVPDSVIRGLATDVQVTLTALLQENKDLRQNKDTLADEKRQLQQGNAVLQHENHQLKVVIDKLSAVEKRLIEQNERLDKQNLALADQNQRLARQVQRRHSQTLAATSDPEELAFKADSPSSALLAGFTLLRSSSTA